MISVDAEGSEANGAPLFSVGVRSLPGSRGDADAARGRGDDCATETLTARYVVWAAGEFQYPRDASGTIAGAELCTHNSRVRSWATLPGDDLVVIGGCVISPDLP